MGTTTNQAYNDVRKSRFPYLRHNLGFKLNIANRFILLDPVLHALLTARTMDSIYKFGVRSVLQLSEMWRYVDLLWNWYTEGGWFWAKGPYTKTLLSSGAIQVLNFILDLDWIGVTSLQLTFFKGQGDYNKPSVSKLVHVTPLHPLGKPQSHSKRSQVNCNTDQVTLNVRHLSQSDGVKDINRTIGTLLNTMQCFSYITVHQNINWYILSLDRFPLSNYFGSSIDPTCWSTLMEKV